MRFCQAHWSRLRAAIHERGLTPLVARNGREALERVVEEIEGTATKVTYDPLMSCHWMITINATAALGMYMLGGDYCPVCEIVKVHGDKPCEHGCSGADVEERWINQPADAALDHVKQDATLSLLAGLST